MSTTPEEPTAATLEERVAQLEIDLQVVQGQLDAALTANAVLQERYGALAAQIGAVVARVDGLVGMPEATP